VTQFGISCLYVVLVYILFFQLGVGCSVLVDSRCF
jgi:hypothetical protein